MISNGQNMFIKGVFTGLGICSGMVSFISIKRYLGIDNNLFFIRKFNDYIRFEKSAFFIT